MPRSHSLVLRRIANPVPKFGIAGSNPALGVPHFVKELGIPSKPSKGSNYMFKIITRFSILVLGILSIGS